MYRLRCEHVFLDIFYCEGGLELFHGQLKLAMKTGKPHRFSPSFRQQSLSTHSIHFKEGLALTNLDVIVRAGRRMLLALQIIVIRGCHVLTLPNHWSQVEK